MGLYDSFKDVLSVAQKADNIELYKQLLDLSAQALDLQNENARLVTENTELKRIRVLEDDLEYYPIPYLTRKSDTKEIYYCAACWASKKALVPLQRVHQGKYQCGLCKTYIHEKDIDYKGIY